MGWAFWMTCWAFSAGTKPTRRTFGELGDFPQPAKAKRESNNSKDRVDRFILVHIVTERSVAVQMV